MSRHAPSRAAFSAKRRPDSPSSLARPSATTRTSRPSQRPWSWAAWISARREKNPVRACGLERLDAVVRTRGSGHRPEVEHPRGPARRRRCPHASRTAPRSSRESARTSKRFSARRAKASPGTSEVTRRAGGLEPVCAAPDPEPPLVAEDQPRTSTGRVARTRRQRRLAEAPLVQGLPGIGRRAPRRHRASGGSAGTGRWEARSSSRRSPLSPALQSISTPAHQSPPRAVRAAVASSRPASADARTGKTRAAGS